MDSPGMPAILDLVVGLLEFIQSYEVDGGGQEESADELPEGLGGEMS
jgi:hypothetical protein